MRWIFNSGLVWGILVANTGDDALCVGVEHDVGVVHRSLLVDRLPLLVLHLLPDVEPLQAHAPGISCRAQGGARG